MTTLEDKRLIWAAQANRERCARWLEEQCPDDTPVPTAIERLREIQGTKQEGP